MKNNDQKYQSSYDEFMERYKANPVGAREVGESINDFTQFFVDYNFVLGQARIAFDKKYAEIIKSADGETGKPMSAAKAEVLVKASKEGEDFTEAESHVKNIDKILSALAYLQKGIAIEQGNVSRI